MKLFLFSLLTILVTVNCQTTVGPTVTCEKVLPANTCNALRDIAKKFHENVAIVNQAVTDAFNHHKTRAAEVLAYVKEYLVTRANNFKCEDVLGADSCAKISEIAKKLHLTATQASVAVREAIVNGATQVKDIYNKAVVYMRDRLSNLSCESVLGADKCQAIKDFAAAAHLKASEVNKAVREAIIEGANNAQEQFQKALDFLKTEVTCEKVLGDKVCTQLRTAASELKENVQVVHQAVVEAALKHYTNTKDFLLSVKETLVAKAQNFKCADVMDQATCDKITEVGQKLKLNAAQISTAIKEGVVSAAIQAQTQAKQIYDRVMGFLLNDVKNLKCSDLIDENTCTKISEYAKKIHAKSTDVALAVKEAIVQGANNVKDIYNQATEFLKAKISCEGVFSEEFCDKIRSTADKFHISMQKVDAFLREAISNGVQSTKDLYKKAVAWMLEKWSGIFGDEMQKRSIADGALTGAFIDNVLEKVASLSEKAKAKIKAIVLASKESYAKMMKKLRELIAKYKNGQEVSVYRRSIRETLVETLKKVHGEAKEFIEKMIAKTDEQLEKLKAWIKEKLEKDGITTRGDELEEDIALVKSMIKRSAEDILKDSLQTTSEDESLNDKVIRLFEKYVVDKVMTEERRQKIDAWINRHKSSIEWIMSFSEKLGESYVVKMLGDLFATSTIFG